MSGYSGGPDGRLNVTLRVVADGGSMDEAEALVNAAPALLDIVKRIYAANACGPEPVICDYHMQLARAAIEQATGRIVPQ